MSQQPPLNDDYDFDGLSSIMKHFHTVPFDQFKSDLDQWFERKCKELKQEPDGKSHISHEELMKFKALAKSIYDQAELAEKKKENLDDDTVK